MDDDVRYLSNRQKWFSRAFRGKKKESAQKAKKRTRCHEIPSEHSYHKRARARQHVSRIEVEASTRREYD